MTMTTIEFAVDTDGVALLSIDVKDRSMNVMTPEFLADLSEAVDKLAADDNIKGAVITSGKDSFMAGADLIGLVETFDQRTDAAEVFEFC
jgi:3-hydroxyacyl-CoA dehydrogenase/enoyl-CoA hydratase/3-hydroxybutyryl-CoA epimerase